MLNTSCFWEFVGDFRVIWQITGEKTASTWLSITPIFKCLSLKFSIDWGEAGCPSNVRAFLNFLEELSALRNHITTNAVEIIGVGRNKNPPALGKKTCPWNIGLDC